MYSKSLEFRIASFRQRGLVWILCVVCVYSLIPSVTVTQGQTLKISAAHIAKIQAALQQLGYNPGPVDGIMGKQTAAAIKAFQTQLQVSVDGQPSLALIGMLQGELAKQSEPASASERSISAETGPSADANSPTEHQVSPETNPPVDANPPVEMNPSVEGGAVPKMKPTAPSEPSVETAGAAEGRPPTKPGSSASTEPDTSAPISGIGRGTIIAIGAGAVAAIGGVVAIAGGGSGSNNGSNSDDESSGIPGPLGGYCNPDKTPCRSIVLWWQYCVDDNGCVYYVFGDGKVFYCADYDRMAENLPVSGGPLPAASFQFLHDRVQHAAYAFIDEASRQGIHLKIGRLLLANLTGSERDEKIFTIVNHLNLGKDLSGNQTEQNKLAELNLAAGRKVQASAAYLSAFKYLQVGIGLLPENRWQRQYDLTLALHVEAAEAACLSGEFEQMEQLARIVLQHARTLVDKVKIYEVKIMAYIAQNKPLEAVQIALPVLELGRRVS
ncbi:multi-sensor signal transduction multi-kinase [Candidatus Vecturithrix granuli]|uniref:Multi-sensor signal transduction multi-kinase n=1 Tax=Vecturithrix granuli TaxID=1499967 RepID=A0A081C1A6_VECG1|nr:multi-sensor signal transduction multi-kinase [Candidatus Vecturithrix granuli]